LLCDYFDLIGGTSTGSIIAAGLACGMTVYAPQELYSNIGERVFQPGGLAKYLPESFRGKFAPKFPSGPLQRELDRQLGAETTLDSDKIRTGLMIMTKRLDTGSPWPLSNGGRGKFAAQDGALRLTQIVRASTAAPTYFAPEEIVIHSRDGTAVDGAFVDGGVTPFNDPALQLLMLAALQGHGSAGRRAGTGCSSSRSAPATTRSRVRRMRSSPTRRPCRVSPPCSRSWMIASG
jgi:patatin-like phospholipase/acyl hydrolase